MGGRRASNERLGSKKKKKGFLLSINDLLMYHITPELKYQEVAETIKLYSIHLIQWLPVRMLEMHVDQALVSF